jgi:hypothetical protein
LAICRNTTLDPHTVADLSRAAVRLNFYDGLYRLSDNPPWLAVVNSRLLRTHATGDEWAANWLVRNEAGSGSYRWDSYNPAVALIAKRFQTREGHTSLRRTLT